MIQRDSSPFTLSQAQKSPKRRDSISQKHSSWARKILSSPVLHIAVLILLVWACFGRTLGSYFLADDFGEVIYVSQIFNGHPERLWSNFTGNYMQIASMSVYRPWLLMTLVFDYLIWRGNALGYYLTNLLYFSGDVTLLYFVTRHLTGNWSNVRSCLTAFFSAALFAVSPLHCESISWVVGRVDSACCFYYLASLYLLLVAGKKASALISAAAVVCFWLALLVKEMAIGLPILATAMIFLWPLRSLSTDETKQEQIEPTIAVQSTWQHRLLHAFRCTLPLWISIIAYFILRYLTLRTFLGGYSGAIGDAQSASAIERWLDADTLYRLIFPFAFDLFNHASIYSQFLSGFYLVIVGIIVVKFLARELPIKWLLLLAAWFITTALPIYRLWGIGANLEGARFCFFLTMPLSLLLPILIFSPAPRLNRISIDRKFLSIGLICLAGMAAVFFRVTYMTNLLWVHAGKEVHELSRHAVSLALKTPKEKKIVVLGIPKYNFGAHMILNGDTFEHTLLPPFVQSPLADRFLTFDPRLFGPDEFVNSERLKRCLSKKNVSGPFLWSDSHKGFILTKLDPLQNSNSPPLLKFDIVASKRARGFEGAEVRGSDQSPVSSLSSVRQTIEPYTHGHAQYLFDDGIIKAQAVAPGDGLRLYDLNVNPLNFDFLEFEVRTIPAKLQLTFEASWKGEVPVSAGSLKFRFPQALAKKTVRTFSQEQFETVRIRLSHYWRWYTAGTIREITLKLPEIRSLEIRRMKLVKAQLLVPELRVLGKAAGNDGTYIITGPLSLLVNTERLANAHSIKLQISKPNFFYDHFSPENQLSAVAKSLCFPGKQKQLSLDISQFPVSGYYDLRTCALDKNGRQLGEYSDSIICKR